MRENTNPMGQRVKQLNFQNQFPIKSDRHVFKVIKPKGKKPKESTLNYCKLYPHNWNPNIAVHEAVLADLTRRIFPNFTAKNRVNVAPTTFSRPHKTHLLSKAIEFTPAYKLSAPQLENLFIAQKNDISKLILAMIGFANPDLHAENWGVDDNNHIVMIDFDNALPKHVVQLKSKKDQFVGETTEFILYPFPNLIYDEKELFAIISTSDIQHITCLSDIKPYNHPFIFKLHPEIFASFQNLYKNDEFKKHLFFNITKYFLLMNDEHLQLVINDHSIGHSAMDNSLLLALQEIRDALRNAFFQWPEYQKFLTNFSKNKTLMGQLKTEINLSNQEFCNRFSQEKKEKAYRCIQFDTALSLLKKLQSDATTEAEKLKLTTYSAGIEINLTIQRIIRETPVADRLAIAILRQIEEKIAMPKLVQQCKSFSFKPLTRLLDNELKVVTDFLDKFHMGDFLFNCYKNATVQEFFNFLIFHIDEYRNTLEKWKIDSTGTVKKLTQQLFSFYGHHLTAQNINHLWIEISKISQTHLYFLAETIFEHISFDKIPSTIFDYLNSLTKADLVRTSISKIFNQPIMRELCSLLLSLKQPRSAGVSFTSNPAIHSLRSSFAQYKPPHHLPPRHNSNETTQKLIQCILKPNSQMTFTAEELKHIQNILYLNHCNIDISAVTQITQGNPNTADLFVVKLTKTKRGLLALSCQNDKPQPSSALQEMVMFCRNAF